MNIRRIAGFIAIAFGLSWALGFGFFASGGRVNSGAFVVMALVYMFTPAIAAVLTQRFVARKPMKELGLGMPRLPWLAVAWLAPIVIVGFTLLASVAVPGVTLDLGLTTLYEKLGATVPTARLAELHQKLDHGFLAIPGMLLAISAVQGLIAGPSINGIAAFGEEFGWRGFLAPELSPLGFWRSSFLTGLIWGIWHLPLIVNGYNYPAHPVLGPIVMTALTVLLAPLMFFLRIRARSVFAPAVFHGTFNAFATFALFLRGGTAVTVGSTGMVGLAVLAAANCVLWQYLRRNPHAADWPIHSP